MRAVLQRVSRAQVRVDGAVTGEIGQGYVALLGVERGDTQADVDYIVRKIADLRLWPDAAGAPAGDNQGPGPAHRPSGTRGEAALEPAPKDARMNLPLPPGAGVLAISQFTLCADTRRGLRPSFDQAAPPEEARPLYEAVVHSLRTRSIPVATGIFQAHMEVELINDGPVTVILNSRG